MNVGKVRAEEEEPSRFRFDAPSEIRGEVYALTQ